MVTITVPHLPSQTHAYGPFSPSRHQLVELERLAQAEFDERMAVELERLRLEHQLSGDELLALRLQMEEDEAARVREAARQQALLRDEIYAKRLKAEDLLHEADARRAREERASRVAAEDHRLAVRASLGGEDPAVPSIEALVPGYRPP